MTYAAQSNIVRLCGKEFIKDSCFAVQNSRSVIVPVGNNVPYVKISSTSPWSVIVAVKKAWQPVQRTRLAPARVAVRARVAAVANFMICEWDVDSSSADQPK